MAEKSKKYPRYTSPIGTVCGFTSLAEPDTKFKAEGQYHTRLKWPAEMVEEYRTKAKELAEAKLAEIIKAAEEAGDKKKLKALKEAKVVSPFKVVEDDEANETGELEAGFKMTNKVKSKKTGKTMIFTPTAFDAKGNKIALVNPWGGSKLKVNFEMSPYFNEKDKEAGVSFRLYAYQVIELVQGSGGTAESFGFGEEEGGFVGSNDEPSASTDGETSTDGDSGADDSDF